MKKSRAVKSKLPEIKKTISAFLVGEEGKISKQSIVKAGVILSAVSLGIVKSTSAEITHENTMGELTYQGGVASTGHAHHASHSAHSAHSSHGSHDSGGGC